MKKLILILFAIALSLSLIACGGDGDGIAGSAETDDTPDSTDDTLDFSDTESILALYRAAERYDAVTFLADTDIYSMSTDFSIHSTNRSYSRDTDGNVSAVQTGDKKSDLRVIGDTYYKNGEAVSNLPAEELASISEALRSTNYDFGYDVTTRFDEIVAAKNDNGTYTIACHTEDEAVVELFTDGVVSDLDGVFSDGADFEVSAVDYQLMIDKYGKPLAFIVAASFELLTDKAVADDSLENYYSYIFVSSVSECTETVKTPE